MFNRPLHKQPFPLPEGITLPEHAQLPFENVYHSPGENAAIRFFDPNSKEDLFAVRAILQSKQVKKWMDDTRQVSESEYREWAGTESDTSFLFAIHDSRKTDPEETKFLRGFIYFYSEREEKFRVRRMEKQGFLQTALGQRYVLEVSFAARPLQDGPESGSGLMSSALRQSCLQVKMLLDSPQKPVVELFAMVDVENMGGQRTLEASGFEKKGQMKYDWDSPVESYLYFLNWELLQNKIRQKLLASLPVQESNHAV
ncbi:MAG: hypothetical protein ABI425_00050 [Patescibacteria group bacterium]